MIPVHIILTFDLLFQKPQHKPFSKSRLIHLFKMFHSDRTFSFVLWYVTDCTTTPARCHRRYYKVTVRTQTGEYASYDGRTDRGTGAPGNRLSLARFINSSL